MPGPLDAPSLAQSFRLISRLLDFSTPLIPALECAATETRDPEIARTLRGIAKRLVDGTTMTEAMNGAMPPFVTEVTELAETEGFLPLALDMVADRLGPPKSDWKWFWSCMSRLAGDEVPVPTMLSAAGVLSWRQDLREAALEAASGREEGEPLADALERRPEIFPKAIRLLMGRAIEADFPLILDILSESVDNDWIPMFLTGSNPVSLQQELTGFFALLSLWLDAGATLKDAAGEIEDSIRHPGLRACCAELKASDEFSGVFARHPKIFTPALVDVFQRCAEMDGDPSLTCYNLAECLADGMFEPKP